MKRIGSPKNGNIRALFAKCRESPVRTFRKKTPISVRRGTEKVRSFFTFFLGMASLREMACCKIWIWVCIVASCIESIRIICNYRPGIPGPRMCSWKFCLFGSLQTQMHTLKRLWHLQIIKPGSFSLAFWEPETLVSYLWHIIVIWKWIRVLTYWLTRWSKEITSYTFCQGWKEGRLVKGSLLDM